MNLTQLKWNETFVLRKFDENCLTDNDLNIVRNAEMKIASIDAKIQRLYK